MVEKRRLFLCSLLLILVLATLSSPIGCGTLGSRPKSALKGYSDLTLELWVSDEAPSTGEPLKLRFRVANHGEVDVRQVEDNRPVMDILVHYREGASDYYDVFWSDEQEITPEMKRLELAPGESKTIEWTWIAVREARGSPSLVRGVLRSTNKRGEPREETVGLSICVDGCPPI